MAGLLMIRTTDEKGESITPEFTQQYGNVNEILDIPYNEQQRIFGSKMIEYDYPPQKTLLEMMAATHSIGILDGELIGDP